MDTDIVTVFSVRITSSPDGIEAQHTTDSTIMNVCLHCYDAPALPDIVYCADCLKIYQDEYEASLQSCYLCEQPARHIYHTTSFTWQGHDWPSEPRDLCDLHMRQACALMVESVEVRVEAERQYEALLGEDDSDYEPYYSRADEMADQALADYYDEVARGGQVA